MQTSFTKNFIPLVEQFRESILAKDLEEFKTSFEMMFSKLLA